MDTIPETIKQKAYNYATLKQKLNLKNPITIQDKIGYIKAIAVNKLKTQCTDKLQLSNYCIKKLGYDLCIPKIVVYDKISDINIKTLPNSFVLKANHGCGYNLIVRDKTQFSTEQLQKYAKKWITENYAFRGYELQYYNIKPHVFVEQYMTDGNSDLTDYKFLCFNGIPVFCEIINDRHILSKKRLNYYDMDFNFIDMSKVNFPNNKNLLDAKPKNWLKMIQYAKILSNDFDFVRVDFYEINNTVYLGELTFTPGNANFKYKNPQHSIMLGNMLKLKI